MKYGFFLVATLILAQTSQAQFSRYIIQFTNKNGTPYSLNNPQQYLSARAIERRTRYNIPIDSTDLPVTPRYVDSLKAAGAVTILNTSKWLNSVTIQTTDQNALNKIKSLPFVVTASPIALRVDPFFDRKERSKIISETKQLGDQSNEQLLADFYDYGASYNQVHIHNGEFLHNIGLRGQGMIIGMLDAGYFSYTTLKAFDSVRADGRILGTWDFVARESSVVEDNAHGMQCFSIIAANIPGSFVGTAPKASFYLFRTEDAATEYPIEEHNWVVGAERVDSAGGDLISSSLGYSTFDNASFNYTYSQLNGRTAISTKGARLAAKKGILVLNSAGNEGSGSWKYIIAPADADSILAVGAVNTSGQPASFSSFGPSADGRVKPDVASVGVGTVIQGTNNTIVSGNGTSFACPNMAGLTTCLWQGFTEFNNIKIIQALKLAGSTASATTDRVGYGIPDVKKATMMLLKDFATTTATLNNCVTTINWKSKDMAAMRYELERKAVGETTFKKIADIKGTGTIFSNKNLSFTDTLKNFPAGTVSYRIRQVIDTTTSGFTADFIGTTAVNLVTSCVTPGADVLTLFPNPVKNLTSLKVTTQNAVNNLFIRITDGVGRTVYSTRKSKQAGAEIYNLPVYNFASGKYYVSVFDGENLLATIELIKL